MRQPHPSSQRRNKWREGKSADRPKGNAKEGTLCARAFIDLGTKTSCL